MAFKAAGAPCDLMREHILLNSSSFVTTANRDSGDFRFDAITEGTPARLTHVHDNTAWSTQPLEDSWNTRLRQGWTPANKNGDGTIGGLTQALGDSYWLYKNLTATGVSTISISQFGLLHGIVVNQYSTAAATCAIYDATTTAAAPFIIGTPQLNAVNGTDFIYDCEFANGLTVSIGSAATPINITVIYR